MHGRTLDISKLEKVLLSLKEKDIVRGISISGGEPFTDATLLSDVLDLCFEIFGKEIEISINTNGSGLKDLHKIKSLVYVDAIHISRHHYDDDKNALLFGGKVPSAKELKEVVDGVPFKEIFVFNCLLLKDYIGTTQEVHRFLDFAIDVGVPKTAFVTAMEINDFTKDQRVSFSDVISRDDSKFLFTQCFRDYDCCCCQDGVYHRNDGRLCEFYGRETAPGGPGYVRGFVYGADNHLRTGYYGDVII